MVCRFLASTSLVLPSSSLLAHLPATLRSNTPCCCPIPACWAGYLCPPPFPPHPRPLPCPVLCKQAHTCLCLSPAHVPWLPVACWHEHSCLPYFTSCLLVCAPACAPSLSSCPLGGRRRRRRTGSLSLACYLFCLVPLLLVASLSALFTGRHYLLCCTPMQPCVVGRLLTCNTRHSCLCHATYHGFLLLSLLFSLWDRDVGWDSSPTLPTPTSCLLLLDSWFMLFLCADNLLPTGARPRSWRRQCATTRPNHTCCVLPSPLLQLFASGTSLPTPCVLPPSHHRLFWAATALPSLSNDSSCRHSSSSLCFLHLPCVPILFLFAQPTQRSF